MIIDSINNHDCKWDIMCCVKPDALSLFRIPMFLIDLPNYLLNVRTSMINNEDTGFLNFINNESVLHQDIINKITEQKWDKIYTHGQKGEYGHKHHVQIHNLVLSACQDLNLVDILYVFDPLQDKKNACISDQKSSLFAATYDKEEHLPSDHPKEWIRGWNTGQGWIEGFKKWI
jgi:hypothetical protein